MARIRGLVEKPKSAVRELKMQDHQQVTKESPAATKALEEVRRIVMDVIGAGKATVYLFGSWARGEATLSLGY